MSDTDEPLNLSKLIGEVKPKRRNLLQEYFFKDKTPEEIAAWRKQAAVKRNLTKQKQKDERLALAEKARGLVPEVMAYDLAAEETGKLNWVPKQETIDKIKMLLEKNMTLEKLRSKYFSKITDETWHKLMKFVFKSQVSQSEDLGAELLRVKAASILRIKKSIREVRKQMKAHQEEKKTKLYPAFLMQLKKDLESQLMEFEMDVAKTLFQVGAVGEKSKSPAFHIHTSLPRPVKQEKVVEEI